jgi:hypothetical protein
VKKIAVIALAVFGLIAAPVASADDLSNRPAPPYYVLDHEAATTVVNNSRS